MTKPVLNRKANSRKKGGRTTNSPPSKIVSKLSPYQVLGSGVDTLYLAIEINWLNTVFFQELAEKKAEAQELNQEIPFTMLLIAEEKEEWQTLIKPHGSGGYEWILAGKDFSFVIGKSQKPKSRPNMMVEIHSEALWRMGYEKAVETVKLLIMAYAGKIISIKPSRIDMCVDMLMPSEEWNISLLDYNVSRAVKASFNIGLTDREVETITIGSPKAVIKARMYDKALEIEQQSKKLWMYDIWGIEKIPDGYKMIRVEFQLRREVIKELGIELIEDFFSKVLDLWGYCTEKWLSFKDHPEKQHILRKTLPWWKAVQRGFDKTQKPNPLVRRKAFNVQEKQLFCQTYGLIRSLEALKIEKKRDPNRKKPTMLGALLEFCDLAPVYGKNDDEFFLDVQEKRSKYQRLRDERVM